MYQGKDNLIYNSHYFQTDPSSVLLIFRAPVRTALCSAEAEAGPADVAVAGLRGGEVRSAGENSKQTTEPGRAGRGGEMSGGLRWSPGEE